MATAGGKLIGYTRVSTEGQSVNGYSLDGQRDRLTKAAEAAGFELVDVVVEVKSGAKQRDAFDEAWARVLAGEAEGLAFAKLDRIGRSLAHLGGIIEEAEDKGLTLFSSDEGLHVYRGEVRNQAVKILAGVAAMERKRISDRTKEGLAAARQAGWPEGPPGRKAENVGKVAARATVLRRQGFTVREIADQLNAAGHRTARGAEFRANTVWRMVERTDKAANPEGGYPKAEAVAVAA